MENKKSGSTGIRLLTGQQKTFNETAFELAIVVIIISTGYFRNKSKGRKVAPT
ncbi:hypothetical protein [Metabacillus sp. RGM 3146]|uniref:hypothetical protein n=1 Tax=Metabacillus sp. RGM 3146 TaxID=3401092 RepID=UPI003B9AB170